MMRGPLIMAAVATVSGAAGLVVFTRPVRSDPQRYAHRIAGMMFLALALLLGSFAWVLAYEVAA